MAKKWVTALCYWNGSTKQGSEGLCYDKPPDKAIKIQKGTTYKQLVDKLYFITSLDKQRHELKIICRYPSVVGQLLKYMPIPIKEDDDIDIMFEALSKHSELSNIDLYLEIEPVSNRREVQGLDSDLQWNAEPNVEVTTRGVSMDELILTNNEGDNENDGRINWNVMRQLVDNEDFISILQSSHLSNEMIDEPNFEEEISIHDVSDGEEAMLEVNEDVRTTVQLDVSLQEPLLRSGHAFSQPNVSSSIPQHKPSSIDFINMECAKNSVVSNWALLPQQYGYHPDNELCKGFVFTNKDDVIRAVKLYSIKRNQQYEVVETSPTIWSLRCKKQSECDCKWRFRACKRSKHGMFEVTQYIGPHTCVYPKLSRDHPHLDAALIAYEIQHLVRDQPSITISALRAEVTDKLGYTVSYKKVWNGKQKAIENIFGDWDASYEVLPKFMAALQFYNEGTIMEWCTKPSTYENKVEFRRVFWSFAASIEGFKHCRPVISIDATHLYGKYRGTMMIAMGADGNNQILPLGFAIVDKESYDTWRWFLHHIKNHVTQQRSGICLISDRHNGILKTINEVGSPWQEPNGFHRYCLRHFVSNFNKKFRNSRLKSLAYQAGSQNQLRKFNAIMEEIGKLNAKAREWLEKHQLSKWTLTHDGGRRYGMMTTNLSEVFNGVLKGARSLPITACVQLTFYRLVHYFDMRRAMGLAAQSKGEVYTPLVVSVQTALMFKASAFRLKSFDRIKGLFEVVTKSGKNVQVVDLDKGTCTCSKWQIHKFPCSHVLSVCGQLSLNSWQYIEKYYSIEEYTLTWAPKFYPLPDQAYWPTPTFTMIPDPSTKRVKKGRPCCTRLKNEMDIKEGRTMIRCGLCKESGHDRRKCPSKPRKLPGDLAC